MRSTEGTTKFSSVGEKGIGVSYAATRTIGASRDVMACSATLRLLAPGVTTIATTRKAPTVCMAATVEAERTAANADCPILMIHGVYDNVISIERAQASRDKLLALGYPVQWQTYPMQHSVCAEEIVALGDWLDARFAAG